VTPGSIGGSRPGPEDLGGVSPKMGNFSEQAWGISGERQHYGADPAGATVRAAQFGALVLGWRLFERYLIAAGALESIPVQDLRDAVLALNRRIGRRSVARAARAPAAGHRARAGTARAGRAATVRGVRLCARRQVRRRRR
jgi:hypothetical protein